MHSSGKVAYQGETDASGAFSTPQLSPGNYVVQLNAKSAPKGGPFSLVLEDTGKGVSMADSIAAGKFAHGGVAMKIEVGPKAMSLKGHIAHGGAGSHAVAAAAAGTPVPKDGITKENGKKVKYENGKKYVWVEGISAMGGHWAYADSAEARNSETVKKTAPSQGGAAGDH